MSKGNMLLGHARGKVGSLVFSRTNGQQVVRSRAEVVKNPQTEKQMIQRIILNTVSQAYSRFQAITDHSFEGVQVGQKSMSYFMSKNMQRIRERIAQDLAQGVGFEDIYAFVEIGSNSFAVNEFIISKGTLPEIAVDLNGVSTTRAKMANVSANTYQAILDAYGLQRGDQLTFVATVGANMQNTQFVYTRVILDPVNADGSQADLSSAFIANGAINLPNPRNEGEFAAIEFDTDGILYGFSQQVLSSAAVIVSRQKGDGTWARSNAVMVSDPVRVAGFQLSLGECLERAASGSIDTLSERYLNNSGTGALASSVASGPVLTALTVDGRVVSRGSLLAIDTQADAQLNIEVTMTGAATLGNPHLLIGPVADSENGRNVGVLVAGQNTFTIAVGDLTPNTPLFVFINDFSTDENYDTDGFKIQVNYTV